MREREREKVRKKERKKGPENPPILGKESEEMSTCFFFQLGYYV